MPYSILHSDGERVIPVADKTVDSSTSLKFVGNNYNGYAKDIAENFLHLLESFASNNSPSNPTIGQLWYDTDSVSSISKPQLKVFDGTNFVSATNVFKSYSKPSGANIGDIWVDISKQQMYIYTGLTNGDFVQSGSTASAEEANWILVGPQFSEGAETGPLVDTIYDNNPVEALPHNVIKFIVGSNGIAKTIAIIAFDEFVPNPAIAGFTSIKKGLNLADNDTDFLDNKVWGTAYQADNLLVNGTTVSSSNFFRKDAINETSYKIKIANADGLVVGSNGTTEFKNSSTGSTIISNSIDNSEVVIRLANGTGTIDSVSVSKTSTDIATDVTVAGETVFEGSLNINSTDDADALTQSNTIATNAVGSLIVRGGVGIAGNLVVEGGVELGNTVSAQSILPRTTKYYDIGSSTMMWRSIYSDRINATEIHGNLIGTFTGNVNGSASSLSTATSFSVAGVISSAEVLSSGDGNPVVLQTTATQELITSHAEITDAAAADQLLVNSATLGLRKIKKSNFLASVPLVQTGSVILYAGTVVPNSYKICDGSVLLQTNYQQLYAAIGHTYVTPAVDTAIEFAIPDLTGLAPHASMKYLIYTGK